jgi:hypothetical protein
MNFCLVDKILVDTWFMAWDGTILLHVNTVWMDEISLP